MGLRFISPPANVCSDFEIGIRGPPLPPRRWSLGRYGLAVNIISLCFILPFLFFAVWPVATPVTA
jgi:choline transport protein